MSSAAEQRQAVADLTAIARRDLDEFWRLLEGSNAEQVRDALMDVLPGFGGVYGDAATSMAADWYEDVREASQARGVFSPVLASPPGPARWDALARWGVTPLFSERPDSAIALAKVAGGLQRSIADQHRMTIVESSLADPAASGWRRVGVGDACSFCRMLIGRGHVYTEATSTFRSHDNCNCAASPSFAPNVVKISREPYKRANTLAAQAEEGSLSVALRNQDVDGFRSAIEESLGSLDLPEGMVTKVDTKLGIGGTGVARIQILHPDGRKVGSALRTFGGDQADRVSHENFVVKREWQGKGVATKINRAMESMYRRNGIKAIELDANIDVGGYSWARAGYDWHPVTSDADTVLRVLGKVESSGRGDPGVLAQVEKARATLDGPREEWVTPFDLSQIGWVEGADMWAGKKGMLDSAWGAIKRL